MKGPGTIECFFGSQNISQELLYQVVCFSTDEQPGGLVHFYTDTEEKILRLRTAKNKFVIKAGIPNATNVLNGWNAGLRFVFCSVQSLYGFLPTVSDAKRTSPPGCTALEKYI